MFFIGIFGVEHKQKKVKDIKSFICKECKLEDSGQLIKSYRYFHFFFIPLFKWNERYYITCSKCSSISEISKEKGKKIEKGETEDITYWDIKDVHVANKREICSVCMNEVENKFTYCPHCGNRLK